MVVVLYLYYLHSMICLFCYMLSHVWKSQCLFFSLQLSPGAPNIFMSILILGFLVLKCDILLGFSTMLWYPRDHASPKFSGDVTSPSRRFGAMF